MGEVYFLQQILGFIQFHFYRDLGTKIPNDLNERACEHILSVRVKYFKDRNFSEVMAEMFQDIANISTLTDVQFLTSFVSLFKIFAGVIALFFIDWTLTLIMLATIPIKIGVSIFLFKKQEEIYKHVMRFQTNFSKWLGDAINGIVEIKLLGVMEKKLIELKDILEDGRKSKSKSLCRLNKLFSRQWLLFFLLFH